MKKLEVKRMVWTCLVCWSGWSGQALMAEESNPYLSIVDRNPFQLKDPPPPAEPEKGPDAPPPPGVIIKLTGIASIFKPPKAIFEVTDQAPGGESKKPILSAGEKQGDLEVISIDAEKSIVSIRHGGAVSNITFTPIETAKAAPAPTNPAPGRGRPLQGRQQGLPNPASAAAAAAAAAAAKTASVNAGPTIITRGGSTATDNRGGISVYGAEAPVMAPTMNAATSTDVLRPSYNATATANANAARLRTLPNRNMSVDPLPTQPNPQAQPAMTQEQLKYWIEANRMVRPDLPWPTVTSPGGALPTQGGEE